MPAPGAPGPEIAEVLEDLETARQQLAGAGERLQRTNAMADRGHTLGHRDVMVLRVLIRSREFEAQCWAEEVRALEDRARALGLQP